MAVGLGSITALAPLAIDMYLPALSVIANDFQATAGDTSLTLMTFFAGFTLGQLFYGPVSDRVGRKPVIYGAISLFIIASIGIMLSRTIGQMIGWRLVQGLGGSVGMVIAMAMVRDLYTGQTAAKLLAMIMMITGLAPIVAPIVGGGILTFSGWKTIFMFFAVFGLFGILWIKLHVPETRMEELRSISNPAKAFRHYGHLLASRSFIPYALTLAFGQGAYFAYIGGSSAVLVDVMGLSPQMYSVAFGISAIGMAIGAPISARLIGLLGAHRIVKIATAIYALAAFCLLAIECKFGTSPVVMVAFFFVEMAMMGALFTNCNMLAMEAHGQISGIAAALIGALGYGFGAIGNALVGAFDNGTAMPMLLIMSAFTMACVIHTWVTYREPDIEAVPNPQHS